MNKPSSAAHTTRTVTCTATAPTRIDLAGGTLDVWPLAAILQEKFDLWNSPIKTVNVAIDLLAKAQLSLECGPTEGPLHWTFIDSMSGQEESGLDLSGTHASRFVLHRAVTRFSKSRIEAQGFNRLKLMSGAQAPKGSGLGGSSSLVVAMLGALEVALTGVTSDPRQTCLRAQNLEAGVLGNLAGNQDHFAAALGGVQAVCHSAEGTTSTRIACDGHALLNHIVLAHSGQQHFSAFNNWLILEKALTGDVTLLSKCAEIARIALELPAVLEAGDWRTLATLMAREWAIRRTLAEGISTQTLDQMHDTAMRAGAAGGKVCGAGGGGVLVMVLQEPEQRQKVAQAIAAAGGQLLEAQFASQGVQVSTLP